MKNKEMKTFEISLTKEQKEFFEYAAKVGGFKSLAEFIIKAIQSKAEQIVEEHKKIIASKKDQAIFFDLVVKGVQPNTELKSALKEYNKLL